MEDDLTFIGTATTLLRLGSFTVLTDPNFLHRGQRAWLGKGLWSRRVTEPAMQPADLPRLDAVILSHLHGDHFDRVARRDLDRNPIVVTTPHAAKRLGRWGFRTHALDTWQAHTLQRGDETLTMTAMPAIHARGPLARLLPPVMGTWLEHRRGTAPARRVYLSGDTLTGDHLNAVRERHGEPDVAVVHLGGTRVLWHTVTMDDVQGVDLLRRIRPRTVVPVHYDDYRVFRSPLSDFLARVTECGTGATVHTPGRGETVTLGSTS
jgi:L-ascorbate metabolism protein UlaG (beta-lactamase superfamily)